MYWTKCLEFSVSSSLLPHFDRTIHTFSHRCPDIQVIPKIDTVYILFTFILRLQVTKKSHELKQLQCHNMMWTREFWAIGMCFLYLDLRGRYIPKQSSKTHPHNGALPKVTQSENRYIWTLLPSLLKSKICQTKV